MASTIDTDSVGEEVQAGPRERILQAALRLFVEQGYFNTNVPDISRQSRCSVGSIYHHFLNKEEIAGLLYKQGIGQFRDALCRSLTQDAGAEENIRSMVVAFLAFAESHRLLAQYLWLARHNEFLNDKVKRPTVVGFDELGRKLTRVIKRGVAAGDIPQFKADIFWSIVFGIPVSYVRDWLEGYTSNSPAEAAPVIASACWAALKGAKG